MIASVLLYAILNLSRVASSTQELPVANVGRSMTKRLEALKSQYRRDLVPLTQERETLTREIAELQAVRDVFLEETTVLNARNEELAQLSAAYSRRVEKSSESSTNVAYPSRSSQDKTRAHAHQQTQPPIGVPPLLSNSTSGSSTIYEDPNADPRFIRAQKPDAELHTPSKGKFMKWPGSKAKDVLSPQMILDRKAHLEHNFQQLSVLRFTRCDHCGDKMWGSQLRCTGRCWSNAFITDVKSVFKVARCQFMCDA